MNVLALVNENTAAALEFAIDLDYNTTKVENFVLYNMGTTSTKVSVVRYSAYKGKRDKTIGQMEVLAHSWDETMGGASFDRVIVDNIVEKLKSDPKFVAEGLEDPTTDHRVMARIWKAARKAKEVLNTIKEYTVHIEGVYRDYDLKGHVVSREQFDEEAKPLYDRLLAPIEEAVETSGLEKSDLEGVILMGGASRLVGVQNVLEAYLEDKELKRSLNSDESGAFGALFMAANISTSYKVRPIGTVDVLPFPVGVRVTDLEGGEYNKRGSIFKRNNKLQSIKSMRFGYDKDVRVKAQYDQAHLLPQGVTPHLGTWAIKGVPKVVEDMRAAGIEGNPKIYVTFKLDKNSMIRVEKARAEYQETYEVEVPKKKNATETDTKADEKKSDDADKKEGEEDAEKKDEEADGEKKAEGEEGEGEEGEKKAEGEEGEKAEGDEEKKKEDPKPEPVEMVKETKTRTKKVSLNVEYEGCDVSPFNEEEMTAAKKKLLDLDDADRSVMETAEAKNELESYIYDTRGKFDDLYDEIEKIATEEQKEAALKPLSESEDWMWEVESEDESAGLFKNRLRQTRKLADEILERLSEFEKRPETISEAQNLIEAAKGGLQQLEEEMTWVPEDDRNKLKEKVETYEKWLTEKMEAQEKLADTESPAFKCKSVLKRAEEFTKLKDRLLKWPKPKEKKKKKKKKKKGDKEGDEKTEGEEGAAEGEEGATTDGEEGAAEGEEGATTEPEAESEGDEDEPDKAEL